MTVDNGASQIVVIVDKHVRSSAESHSLTHLQCSHHDSLDVKVKHRQEPSANFTGNVMEK